MNYIEHVHILSSQADADAQFPTPLTVDKKPMTLVSVAVYISAVNSTPTAINIDLNITDGTTTVTPILAQSVGTAAGQVIIQPSTADGYHAVAQDTDNNWRYNLDFNFTGGTSPHITGRAVVRWAV